MKIEAKQPPLLNGRSQPPVPRPADAIVLHDHYNLRKMPNWFRTLNAGLAGRDCDIMSRFYLRSSQLLDQLKTGFSSDDGRLIEQAFDLAWRSHYGQYRKSGEPYIVHVMSAARRVREWGLGAQEIAAAICHDTIEDGWINSRKVTKEHLASVLGERVANLVDGITELGKEPDYSGLKPSKEYIFRKLIDAASKDLAVLIIKFADRLDNMETLSYMKTASAKKKASETLHVYSRIADILGMWDLKRKFEDLSFKYLEPERFRQIKAHRNRVHNQSLERMVAIGQQLEVNFARYGVFVNLEMRGIYELQQRLEQREKQLTDIAADDFWRINLVVPEETWFPGFTMPDGRPLSNCYLAMGMIHQSVFSPAQNQRIEDHIKRPLSNGHRFLHTYVQVPDFGRLLVQIRDNRMNEEYHSGVLAQVDRNPDWHKMRLSWLTSLQRTLQVEHFDEGGLFDALAAESLQIKVLTKRTNKPFDMPRGACALDFAFYRLGEKALNSVNANVNGGTVELSRTLSDGDEVFVNCQRGAQPKRAWLDWVRTPVAIERLRAYFSSLDEQAQLKVAAEYLKDKLAEHYFPFEKLVYSKYFRVFLAEHGFTGSEKFMVQVGGGMRGVDGLLRVFIDRYEDDVRRGKAVEVDQPFLIIARDRIGLLDSIAGPLRTLNYNISLGYFHRYDDKESGEPMAVIQLNLRCAGDEALRKIQQIQVEEAIQRTKVTRITSNPDEIKVSVHYFQELLTGKKLPL